jgi:MoxR-like ATPase
MIRDKISLAVMDLTENKKFLDPLKEYFVINRMDLYEDYIKTVSSIVAIILQGRNLIVSGPPGSGKSKIIKIAAFIIARL